MGTLGATLGTQKAILGCQGIVLESQGCIYGTIAGIFETKKAYWGFREPYCRTRRGNGYPGKGIGESRNHDGDCRTMLGSNYNGWKLPPY